MPNKSSKIKKGKKEKKYGQKYNEEAKLTEIFEIKNTTKKRLIYMNKKLVNKNEKVRWKYLCKRRERKNKNACCTKKNYERYIRTNEMNFLRC